MQDAPRRLPPKAKKGEKEYTREECDADYAKHVTELTGTAKEEHAKAERDFQEFCKEVTDAH